MNNNLFELERTNIMVEFNIYGDCFNPDEITQRLNITPTMTWKKGDLVRDKNFSRPNSLWRIGTGYVESLDIKNQLDEILNVITDKKNSLLELKNILDIKYDVCIIINIYNNETPGLYLDAETISIINSIGASIDFDLYLNN